MKTYNIKSVKSVEELIKSNLLVRHYAGSLAYRTSLPTSDIDIRGIFCADPVNVRTPFFPIREKEDDETEDDAKYLELAHYMKLCMNCNPNIIETLWVDDEDIIFRTPAYDLLREARRKLLSSKIAFTTSGYAISQLKRIKGHKKWISNPQPREAPKPKEFVSLVQWFGQKKMLKFDIDGWNKDYRFIPFGGNLYGVYPEMKRTLYDERGNLNVQFEGDRSEFGSPLLLVKFNKDEYKLAKKKHTEYWEWKTNRNPARSELEEKHSFDTKHAMHLVRLMRIGVEALRDGEILVKRPDAEELLSIRNGAWTYDQLVQYAEEMDNEVRKVWYKKTQLPKKPDIKLAAQLIMSAQDMVWENNK